MVREEVLLEVLHVQFHLEVRGGDQLDGPAGAVALNLGLAGGCFSRPWRCPTSFWILCSPCQQRIASHSPMSMAPMLKSPSRTGLHVAMTVRKGVGIGGSLVAAPIKLSIP